MSTSRRSSICSGAILASLYALLSATPLFAQVGPAALVVLVADPSGGPIAGAHVTASPRDGRVRATRETDAAGEARFDALHQGTYVVEIDAPGFAASALTAEVGAGETSVRATLDLASLSERVVVSGSGRLQTTAELSKAVTVVGREEILARNEFSAGDALRGVPGLSVQQLGGPGAFTSLKLRGLRERDTAILIDGVRFRDAGAPQGDATAFIGDLFVGSLDRIEVLRGSGSSLYGSHAVGGAVNLITDAGSGRPRAEAGAEAGSLGFNRATAHAGGALAGDRLRGSVGAGYMRTRRGIDGDDEARNASLQARATAALPGSARATVRLFGSTASAALNESPAAIGPLPASGFVRATPATFTPALNDPDSVRDSHFLSTLVLVEQRLSSAFGYTASLHHLDTERVLLEGPLGPSPFEPSRPTSFGFGGTLTTGELRADADWGRRHATRFAYEIERERYVSESRPDVAALAWNADIVQDSHALSAHHDVRLDRLQVAGGVRVQRFGRPDVTLDPAGRAPFAAAAFGPPPAAVTADVAALRPIGRAGTKIRAHAGNAYRAPSMFERAGVFYGSRGYTVIGDPALEPERSVSVDAGIDQALAGGRALVSATWFHTRLTRVVAFAAIDAAADPSGRSSGYLSADGRTARGLEVDVRLQPRASLQARVAYTFADAPPPAGSFDGSPRAAAVTRHQVVALVTHQAGPLQTAVEVEAAGDHYLTLFDPVSFGSRAYRFAGFTRADLTVGYALRRGRAGARLFGTVDNLFDRTYVVQGFRAAGRVVRGGVRVTL